MSTNRLVDDEADDEEQQRMAEDVRTESVQQ
jgi:hypothetical protein